MTKYSNKKYIEFFLIGINEMSDYVLSFFSIF